MSLLRRLALQLKTAVWPLAIAAGLSGSYYLASRRSDTEAEYLAAVLSYVGPYELRTLQPGLEVGTTVEANGPIDALEKGEAKIKRYLDGENLAGIGLPLKKQLIVVPLETARLDSKQAFEAKGTFVVAQPLGRKFKNDEDVILPKVHSELTLYHRQADGVAVHKFKGKCNFDNVFNNSKEFRAKLKSHRFHASTFYLVCGEDENLVLGPKNYKAGPLPDVSIDKN